VPEDAFQALIDTFEKEAYYVSPEIDCSQDFPLKVAQQHVAKFKYPGMLI